MSRTGSTVPSGVAVTSPPDCLAWDEFALAHPSATFCHLSGWREIMSDVLGHEPLFRAAVSPDGHIAAILPLVRMRSRLFGHHLISMPFLNYGGPVGDPAAARRLLMEAEAEARRSGADRLELRRRYLAQEGAELPPGRPKVTVLLDLPPEPTDLWNAFPTKLRTKVRRPQKAGMEVRFGVEQVDAFYEVFRRNMRDLGTPVLPRALFDRLPDVFGDSIICGVVYDHEIPLAAGYGFLWRDEYEMTWGSSLREFNRTGANMLLYWAFMEEVVRRRARTFNFGRCTPGGGTHLFKLQWGGRDEPLSWSAWSRGAVANGRSPGGTAFRLATAAWRRLPLAAANRVGPTLARRIPTF